MLVSVCEDVRVVCLACNNYVSIFVVGVWIGGCSARGGKSSISSRHHRRRRRLHHRPFVVQRPAG